MAAPTHGRFGPAVRHFRPVGPLILAQGVFFGSRPEGRRTGSTRSEYDFFNSGFPTGRPGGEGLKRQPAHPLLALQLRRAGLDIDSTDRIEPAAVRHLLEQVDRTYAETDQAMLTVQMAERRSSRELAELYRQLRLEHGELEATARQRAAELAMSQAELAKAQRLASMGNWQYLPQLRRLEVSDELARLLELEGEVANAGPATLLGAIYEDDRPRVRRLLWQAIRRPLSVGDELRVITVGGEVRWFMCRIESELGPDYRISTTVAEGSVVVHDGTRVRAAAVRLEAHRGAWRATVLQIG